MNKINNHSVLIECDQISDGTRNNTSMNERITDNHENKNY